MVVTADAAPGTIFKDCSSPDGDVDSRLPLLAVRANCEPYTNFMAKADSIELYDGIRHLVLSARGAAARGLNLLQVHTNYEIGRRIVEEEQGGADRAQYGKEVIRELAARLTSEFGNGFSKSNLEYMRRFYLAYPGRDPQIAQTLSGRSVTRVVEQLFALSWSHYVFLLGLNEQEQISTRSRPRSRTGLSGI
jgi:hypothetical protein